MAGTVVINDSALVAIAKSEPVRAEILRRCQLVAAQARRQTGAGGSAFEATVVVGRRRVHGSVNWLGGLRREVSARTLSAALEAARG